MPAGNLNTDQANLGARVASTVHPLYLLFKPVWTQLAHVREGTGGFLDGTYLVAHPREWLDHSSKQTDTTTGAVTVTVNPTPKQPSPKLKARRLIARYENVASSILEAKKSTLFREQPTRRVGPQQAPTAKPAVKPPPVAEPPSPAGAL